jgi:acyl-CoA reductase-like NAD-dependent aldehyde dehydrogenase
MSEFTMTIDGAAAETIGAIDVINPATGEVFAQAPDCTPAQLDMAMESAQRAFGAWKDDLELRRNVMHKSADALDEAARELGRVATLEQGMPLSNAIGGVRKSAEKLRSYADLELPPIVIQDNASAFIEVVARPIGVVAAIKPWNSPLTMAVNTVAPALRAGCTVVLKPSPFTPLVTLMFGEVLRDILPAGVLNVISGADPLGQWMTEHPIPRGVSFTGSVATGKKVNVAAAADLKRTLLELGGNDAAIVLDDVDPADVADAIFGKAFGNAGQICMAIKRLFVPENLYDGIVGELVKRAEALHVGNGLDDGVEMGPLNNRPQFERVKELVADAVAAGGKAVAGGAPIEGTDGFFFQPTIVTGVAEGTRLVDEEQFGPALPVMTYRTVEEAIERANATQFGLGSSVWSNDASRARAVAEQLEAGTTWINTHSVLGPLQPFTGRKWSGLGVGNGVFGVHAFCDLHTIYHARPGK